MKDVVFKAWAIFTLWWVPISILFIFIQSDKYLAGGGYIFAGPSPKAITALLSFILYIIISIIVITRKYFSTRTK
jgi:hypothetical protein